MEKQLILERLKSARTTAEWEAICDEVKAETRSLPDSERSGHYPLWWFAEVIMSGLYDPRRIEQ